MKFKKRLIIYNRIVKELGWQYGLKNISRIISAHFYNGEHLFYIKSKKTGGERLFIRTNSSDLELVNAFLLDNGEFDWIYDDKMREYIVQSKYFLDGGANIGLVSRLLLAVNPDLKGIAIEPDESNYTNLKRNLHKYPNVMCVKGGLWNNDSNLEICERNGSKLGFVVKENENGNIRGYRLKGLIKEQKIDICKIDIEGSEYELFDSSADKWIKQIGLFIIELHDRIKNGCRQQVENRLNANGFVHTATQDENDIFIRGDIYEKYFGGRT